MSKKFHIEEVVDGFVVDAHGINEALPKGGAFRTIANSLHEVAAKACWAFLGKHYPNARIVTPQVYGDEVVWIDVLTGAKVSYP